jgi:hypothetical protein
MKAIPAGNGEEEGHSRRRADPHPARDPSESRFPDRPRHEPTLGIAGPVDLAAHGPLRLRPEVGAVGRTEAVDGDDPQHRLRVKLRRFDH